MKASVKFLFLSVLTHKNQDSLSANAFIFLEGLLKIKMSLFVFQN